MEEFIREVQEDMEREKYRVLWKKYGRTLICLACVAIFSAIGFQVYEERKLSAAQEATAVLLKAKKKNSAAAWLEASEKLSGNAKAIALIHANKCEDAKTVSEDSALKSLAAICAKQGSGEVFSSIAAEQEALAALEKGNVDKAKTALASAAAAKELPASARARLEKKSNFVEQHADVFKK